MDWKEKYMKNLVAIETLKKLVVAGKITDSEVDEMVAERLEISGY